MEHATTHEKTVILVVDDDPLLRLTAIDVLEQNGFLVEEADCAETAMKTLEQHAEIRLIFTDIQMPGKFDGIELARRAHLQWPHIGLVVTSGCARPVGEELPDNARFMAKPYSARQLMAQVSSLLAVA